MEIKEGIPGCSALIPPACFSSWRLRVMKPWILLSAALLGVSLTPAETALAKGYDA